MISNINISFLYWLYLYDVNFYLYSPFFKFWHYLLSLDRDFENTSKIDYLKIVKLHDRIFMLFSQFICSFSSFQPRAPKVCPEGAQIFFKFLPPICIHERNWYWKFQAHIFSTSIFRGLSNFTKFAKISCFVFGPIFMKLNFDIEKKSQFGKLIFSNTTGKTNQTT